MTSVMGIFTALGSLLAGALIVQKVRRYALRAGVLDVPDARSSHEIPTPRGGGMGILIPVIIVLSALPLFGVGAALAYLPVAAVILIGFVGWLDDHLSLPVGPRLAAHVVAGVALAYLFVGEGATGLVWLPPGILAGFVWAFWTVSVVNVVNFLDGTDALIGVQALVFGAFSAFALRASPYSLVAWATIGASLGFLAFNWPPARIFMGDVGSGAVGVIFVVLGGSIVLQTGWTIFHAFLPLMPIFIDEVLTLSRRLRDGEKPWQPHRSHVYQLLVRSGWSHGQVAVLYGLAALTSAAIPPTFPHADSGFLFASTSLFLFLMPAAIVLRRRALFQIRKGQASE